MTLFRTVLRRDEPNGEVICQIGACIGAAGQWVVEARTKAIDEALSELASRNLLTEGVVAVTEEVEEVED